MGERLRTTANETKTETTLMIMPHGDATSIPRRWESRTSSVPNFASDGTPEWVLTL